MKIVTFTETVNSCDCCGKVDLKGTYVMETEAGDFLFYGTVCGQKAAKFKTVKEFRTAAKQAEIDNQNAANEEMRNSSEGAFYRSYIGSAEHIADCEIGYAKAIAPKTAHVKIKAAEIARKYKVKSVKY